MAKSNTMYRGAYRADLDKEDEVPKPEGEEGVEKKPEGQDVQAPPAASHEEETWKDRYGNLRKVEADLRNRIKALEEQVQKVGAKELDLPASEDDMKAFIAKYPDVYRMIKATVLKEGEQLTKDIKDKIKRREEMELEEAKAAALKFCRQQYADFDQVVTSKDFHEWLREQPQALQDMILVNETDGEQGCKVVDLYKASKGEPTRHKRGPGRPKKEDAAKDVHVRSSQEAPGEAGDEKLSESYIQRMIAKDPRWYEKNEARIDDAIAKGKFVYDISGGAR